MSSPHLQALNKYGRDLVADAEGGKLDPVIGRDEEIRRVIQVGSGLRVEVGTAKAPENRSSQKETIVFQLQPSIFRGELLVSGRVPLLKSRLFLGDSH